jgi:hypothetical protein
LPTNVQATSAPARAHDIIACGGLVSIKAHVFKTGGGFTLVDGLDADYCDFLDRLFRDLDRRYGETLWWPSLGEISERMAAATPHISGQSREV